ncbi:MAG: Translation elongation factor [Myxococcaceae bacterium]|nr:Translation elongation factor [Myxococcaceae bacterium]
MGQVIDINELRRGNKIDMDGEPYQVVSVDFRKPGKGTPSTSVKMKSMISGNVLERTYKSGEKLSGADIEEREMQYLYAEGDQLVFMDNGTYEQAHVDAKHFEERGFLLDNAICQVLLHNGTPIGVTLPTWVEMEVIETEPGFKGDTANNVLKAAKCTTGVIVQVPIFINQGDMIRIDTRTGEYAERVAKTR